MEIKRKIFSASHWKLIIGFIGVPQECFMIAHNAILELNIIPILLRYDSDK